MMTEPEKLEFAKNNRNLFSEKLTSAEKRTAELADEFTKLEVQIATILFAFMGLFSESFIEGLKGYSSTGIIVMKLAFALIFFFLILSLSLGLVHIKMKEKFWDAFLIQRNNRFAKWEEVVKTTATFEQAEAYQKGTVLGNGASIISSPSWTWILQTIFLGISVLILFVIFMVFLFHPQGAIISI
jgi:hypothetical protein